MRGEKREGRCRDRVDGGNDSKRCIQGEQR